MRLINIDGETWKWMVGKSHVKIVSPKGNGIVLTFEDCTGNPNAGSRPLVCEFNYDMGTGPKEYASMKIGDAITPKHIRAAIHKIKSTK